MGAMAVGDTVAVTAAAAIESPCSLRKARTSNGNDFDAKFAKLAKFREVGQAKAAFRG
jgi:hypothetical protein